MRNSSTLFLAAAIYIAPHAAPMVGFWAGAALAVMGIIFYVKGD